MLKTLTPFTIESQLAEYPKPLIERPEIIPVEHYEAIKNAGGYLWPVGSRTIDGAAQHDSDYDFLFLSKDRIPDVFDKLGYDLLSGGAHYDPSEGRFNSWRLGFVNFIATDEIEFVKRFLVANEAAKRMSLKSRNDRVTLFQAVLYCRVADEPKASVLRGDALDGE
jgi:hypothetical protein